MRNAQMEALQARKTKAKRQVGSFGISLWVWTYDNHHLDIDHHLISLHWPINEQRLAHSSFEVEVFRMIYEYYGIWSTWMEALSKQFRTESDRAIAFTLLGWIVSIHMHPAPLLPESEPNNFPCNIRGQDTGMFIGHKHFFTVLGPSSCLIEAISPLFSQRENQYFAYHKTTKTPSCFSLDDRAQHRSRVKSIQNWVTWGLSLLFEAKGFLWASVTLL